MIFITVGTDQPFDRLLKTVNAWAHDNKRHDVFAQIGFGGWKPDHITYREYLEPTEFRECFNDASLVVSHAGMGTILNALFYGKTILVMPKRASLGEHRNEHQLATARRMNELCGVNVAYDETELLERLNHVADLTRPKRIAPVAEPSLINGLRSFIFQTTSPSPRHGTTL